MESQGVLGSYKYTLTKPQEYGPDFSCGWYIYDTEDYKYVMICHGLEYCGGYFIEVTNIEYDEATDTMTITVLNTHDENIATDALTHAYCEVELNKFPTNIRVVEGDYEMEFGGKIINTKEWAVDVEVPDDYVAIFASGDSGYAHYTYLYELGPNEFRYINVLDRGMNDTYVKGSGTLLYFGNVEYVAHEFDSWEYVMVKGDESNHIPADEYIKDKTG